MANKNRQIVVDLTLDTKDANKQIESVLNSVEGLTKKLGNGKDFSYFTDLINYLGKIEDKLKALQTADPISFENIFGKNAEKIVSQLDSAMSGLMDVPEKLMQAMNAISNTDFTGNLKGAKQAVELLIEVYERLGMEVPKSFDGFKNWKNSSLAKHVQDIKDAANEFRDIDWTQVFSIGGGSGGISSAIGKQVAEIERQIKTLEEQRNKYTQTLRSLDDEIPNELIGASVDEVNKYTNDIMDNIDRIDVELKHLFSQKYELSSGSIFQDFNNEITEALKLDPVSDEFQAQLDKMQAMVDACGEKISGDLATDLQEIVDGFNAKDIDVTGIQSKMEAVIAKYQQTGEAASEAGGQIKSANEEISAGLGGSGAGDVLQEQYDALEKELDETTESAKQLQEQLSNSGGSKDEFEQLNTKLQETENKLKSLQDEYSTLASTSVSQEFATEEAAKLQNAEVEVERLQGQLNGLQQQYNETANAAKKLEEENKQLSQSLEAARSNERDWASRYYNADETALEQEKEIDTLNTKLETTQELLNSINGSGAGLSEEQFQWILQALQDIVSMLQQITEEIQPFVAALTNSETALGQMATEGGASIQTLVAYLQDLSTAIDELSKKNYEINLVQNTSKATTNAAAYRQAILDVAAAANTTVKSIEQMYYTSSGTTNGAGFVAISEIKDFEEALAHLTQLKQPRALEESLAVVLNYYEAITERAEQLVGLDSTSVAKLEAPNISDYSNSAVDKFVNSLTKQNNATTESAQNMADLIAVLEKLSTTLEKVVDTFDQLKVNVTNAEFDAATQKIHELEQEVANLQEQLSGKTVDASGIESTVEKIGSLLDLDALKGKAKDANVFERLTNDFQTLENVLHNKDLANEDKVNRAIALYEALDQKIKTTATDAAVNNAFREQAKSLSDFGNSLRTALSLSGDTKNLKELNAVLKDMNKNASPENIKDYEKQIAQIFDDSGFDQMDLDFSAQLKSYVDELERLSNLDLTKGVKIFDSNDLAQFNSQIEKSKDLIGNSKGIEEYNAQVKALQELLNGLNRQVTAAYQMQDSGGYIPITASSIEILQRNREELALYAESVRNLLTETGHTASARTVVDVIKDINAATDPVQLQNYRNELKAIMNDAGVSTKGLSTVDKTAMDDIETRLVNISKVSQEAGNIMGDMFSKVTTSGGLSFFKEQLESVEKEMSDGLGVQNLVNQVEQLDGLGVFSSDEIKGITDQVNNLKNAMGGMSSEQITAQVKGLQETVDLMDKVATTRLQSSSIDYSDFIPVDKLKGSVEELQAYVVSTFSNMGNLIDGSVQSKGQNAFQWIEKDAQGALTEVTATFDKMGQVVVDKLNIDNVFNSSSKNSWLKTMKTDLTKTINDIISEMGKLMSMDVGSASYTDAEARIQELLNKYQELASQLGNAANTQGFTDGLSKMFANFGAKVSKEIDDIQVKINSLWDSMDVGQEQSMYNQINQLFQVFDNFNNAATIDDKLASMKELQTLLPALASELDGYTQAQKEEAQATKEAAEAESVLTRSDTLSNNIQSWMKQNTAAAEQFKEKLDEILKSLDGNSDPAVLKKATEEFKNVQAQAKNAGVATDSFGKSLVQAALYAVGLGSTMSVFNKIVQAIREAVSIVTELDSAMAQLQIVTGATESEMNQFLESSISLAKELGQSVTDVLESITTFTRLGYNLEDSSTLSEFAGILANVANVDLSNATEGLTSVIKGFSLDVTDAEHISDVLITVGNNYAVSAEEILTAMTKSSAALDASGTSFEKAVAIVAAGNAAVQDASHNWLENHRNMIYRTHLIARTA